MVDQETPDINGLTTSHYCFEKSKGIYLAKKPKPLVLGSTSSRASTDSMLSVQMQLYLEQLKIKNAGFEVEELNN